MQTMTHNQNTSAHEVSDLEKNNHDESRHHEQLRAEMSLENRLAVHGLLHRDRPLLVWQPTCERAHPYSLAKQVLKTLLNSPFDIALVARDSRAKALAKRLGKMSPYVAQLSELSDAETEALMKRASTVLQGDEKLLGFARQEGVESLGLSKCTLDAGQLARAAGGLQAQAQS